jgi:hypothetical protein
LFDLKALSLLAFFIVAVLFFTGPRPALVVEAEPALSRKFFASVGGFNQTEKFPNQKEKKKRVTDYAWNAEAESLWLFWRRLSMSLFLHSLSLLVFFNTYNPFT